MLKKIMLIVALALMAGLLILGFVLKDSMNAYVSKMMKEQVSATTAQTESQKINSLYNYSANKKDYKLTFLEFGALGCSACKQMEKVMKEIKEKYPNVVNVAFYNILIPKNQNLMKYYGVSAIPTQILLDNKGIEYFRHTGYFSANELSNKFNDVK